MKKIRLTAFILSLASCLFLFSAGFSTWFKVVLPTDIDPATGEFTAYSVVDVVSSGTVEKDTFQYTSFGFVDGKNTIEVTYVFTTDQPVIVTLGYENLSSYTGTGDFRLFKNLVGANAENKITVSFNKAVTVSTSANTYESKSSFDVSDSTSYYLLDSGKNDVIRFVIKPTSGTSATKTETVTITYTFNVPTGEGLKGNFRQNMGKYLMAGKDGKYTKFISTVVASSSAS